MDVVRERGTLAHIERVPCFLVEEKMPMLQDFFGITLETQVQLHGVNKLLRCMRRICTMGFRPATGMPKDNRKLVVRWETNP